MNYHDIKHDDKMNGTGLRVTLFVSGCDHHCDGCHNPETWDFDSGIPFGHDEYMEIQDQLQKDYISGITFSGGDPLAPRNRDYTLFMAKQFKELFPDKTVWMYTGYKLENLGAVDLSHVDVLCDGRFEQDKADPSKKWVGSSNQRVIDMNATRKYGKVILYDEDGFSRRVAE